MGVASPGEGAAPDITDRDVARSAGSALLGRLGAVVEVVAQPAYIWMFGLATYGLYTVLWALVNLVENIADLGMTSALQRVVPQARSEADATAALRAALLLGVGPCLIIALIASFAAPEIAGFINVAAEDQAGLATGIALFAWALPLWALIEINTSALRARRAFGPEIRLRIFWEQVIRLVLATGLWALGVDTLGLLIAHLCSLLITAALSLRLLSRYYDLRLLRPNAGETPMIAATWWAGISVLPSNIIGRLFSDGPPVVLNLWFPGAAGASAAGLYGIARKLASLVQMVRMTFSYVMGPLASAVAHHDRGRVQALYGFSTRLSVVIALPIAAVLIGGGDNLLALFGREALAAWPLVVCLAAARAIDAIGGAAGAIQQVVSHKAHNAISTSLGLAVALLLCPLLLPAFGSTGMALAVGAGMVSSTTVTIIQLYRHDGIHPFAAPFVRTLAIALAASCVTALLLALLPPVHLIVGTACVVAALAACLAVSMRIGLSAGDRQALRGRKKGKRGAILADGEPPV